MLVGVASVVKACPKVKRISWLQSHGSALRGHGSLRAAVTLPFSGDKSNASWANDKRYASRTLPLRVDDREVTALSGAIELDYDALVGPAEHARYRLSRQ
jgi:hypothetical protein